MNGSDLINKILMNAQPAMNRVCRVTMKNSDVRYVTDWDACAGIAIRLHLVDVQLKDCGWIKVDHNNIFDYISQIG